MRLIVGLTILLSIFGSVRASAQATSFTQVVANRLPLYGHRNWIVIADSAYPAQTAVGIETICTGQKQLDVVAHVLDAVEKAPHVRPVVLVDKEMEYVDEQDAKGIAAYREGLRKLLANQKVTSLPHEEIIASLDEAGKTFHVLILKTDLALPYTSVFIRLDAGYWSAEAEAALREKMKMEP